MSILARCFFASSDDATTVFRIPSPVLCELLQCVLVSVFAFSDLRASHSEDAFSLDASPTRGGSVRASFGHNFRWDDRAGFGSIRIDYGDGRSYTAYSEADAERNAFWHKYWNPGSFVISVSFSDGSAVTVTDSCSWTWTSSYSPPPSSGGGRTGAMCRDGWVSSATGSGACSWHGGVDYWLY